MFLQNCNGVIVNGFLSDVSKVYFYFYILSFLVVYFDDEGIYQCIMLGLDLMNILVIENLELVFFNIIGKSFGLGF